MKLIVGLGNPGNKYRMTRHNIGFLAVDVLAHRLRAGGPHTKNSAEYFEAEAFNEKILLIKPQTFMNLSGRAVQPFYNFYKLTPHDLIVIHDEIDFEPFSLKIKKGGGAGGHNGIKSIDESLGSDNTGYFRIRLGVGKQGDPSKYVLSEFPEKDFENLKITLEECADAAELLIQGKDKEAMNKFNQKRSN